MIGIADKLSGLVDREILREELGGEGSSRFIINTKASHRVALGTLI